MRKRLFDFFRKGNVGREGEQREPLQTDFIKSLDLEEENPFADETPDEIAFYDLQGSEVRR